MTTVCFSVFSHHFLAKHLVRPVARIYSQNLAMEGTLHMLHKEEGDLTVGELLLVVVAQNPTLEGLGSGSG